MDNHLFKTWRLLGLEENNNKTLKWHSIWSKDELAYQMWLQTFSPRIAKTHCYHITFILKTDSTPVGNIGHLAYLGNTAARGMLPVWPVYVMSECLPGLHICPYSSICNCLGIFYVHSQMHTVQESDRQNIWSSFPADKVSNLWTCFKPGTPALWNH